MDKKADRRSSPQSRSNKDYVVEEKERHRTRRLVEKVRRLMFRGK